MHRLDGLSVAQTVKQTGRRQVVEFQDINAVRRFQPIYCRPWPRNTIKLQLLLHIHERFRTERKHLILAAEPRSIVYSKCDILSAIHLRELELMYFFYNSQTGTFGCVVICHKLLLGWYETTGVSWLADSEGNRAGPQYWLISVRIRETIFPDNCIGNQPVMPSYCGPAAIDSGCTVLFPLWHNMKIQFYLFISA